MSLGTDRVRASFNPSANTLVDQIKRRAAELIDLCSSLQNVEVAKDEVTVVIARSERNRCVALAQTYFETGAMYAVKAATYE